MGPMSDIPQSADTLEDARTLALHYQTIAAKQGGRLMRMHIALKIIREFGMDLDFHADIMADIREWIDRGMNEPIPWPNSAFFELWAKGQGMSNINGSVGYRVTAKMIDR